MKKALGCILARVRRFPQPIAACVLLIIGVLPATTLVCQWACAPQPAGRAYHEAHHHGALGVQTTTDGTGPLLTSTEQRCDHTTTDFIAISPTLVQLGAPASTAVSTLFGAALLPGFMEAGAVITAPSPPGSPPLPFSLRI